MDWKTNNKRSQPPKAVRYALEEQEKDYRSIDRELLELELVE